MRNVYKKIGTFCAFLKSTQHTYFAIEYAVLGGYFYSKPQKNPPKTTFFDIPTPKVNQFVQ